MAPSFSNVVVNSPTRRRGQAPIHLRRSERLAAQRLEKALQLTKAKTSARALPRRSQRLIERALNCLSTQAIALPKTDSPDKTVRTARMSQKRLHVKGSISPSKKTSKQMKVAAKRVAGASVKRAIVFPTSPKSARNSSPRSCVDVPPVLLQVERECSDFAWLMTRWNDVPYANRTSWDNVLARRGKFLQLACKSGDASLMEAVLQISTAPLYRDIDKWKFVDAVHYGVEYQLYDMLPWLNRFEQSFPDPTSPCESKLMNMALAHGDLRTAEWLYAHRLHVHSEQILQATREQLQHQSPELKRWVKDRYPDVIRA